MKRYVKQDAKGAIEFAPNFVNKEHKLILGYNNEANEKMLLEDGYLIFENISWKVLVYLKRCLFLKMFGVCFFLKVSKQLRTFLPTQKSFVYLSPFL